MYNNLPQKGVSILLKYFIMPILVGIINTLFSYYLNNRKAINKHLNNKHLNNKHLHNKHIHNKYIHNK